MRQWICSIVVVCLLPMAAFSQSPSLSKDPGFVPNPGSSGTKTEPPTTNLVNDGSFELGPPPASAWTEWSSTASEWILDPTGTWGIVSYNGTYSFWGGGYLGITPNSNYVEQSITLPADAVNLRFMMCAYRPDLDDPAAPDTFTVSVNGTVVFTFNLVQANDTYPSWVEQVVDVSAYAGQAVTLRFEVASAGSETGNVLIDFIRVERSGLASIPTMTEWGLILLAVLMAGLAMRKMRPAAV